MTDSSSYIDTFYGHRGDSYAEVKNDDMGIFELENTSNSVNGTGPRYG